MLHKSSDIKLCGIEIFDKDQIIIAILSGWVAMTADDFTSVLYIKSHTPKQYPECCNRISLQQSRQENNLTLLKANKFPVCISMAFDRYSLMQSLLERPFKPFISLVCSEGNHLPSSNCLQPIAQHADKSCLATINQHYVRLEVITDMCSDPLGYVTYFMSHSQIQVNYSIYVPCLSVQGCFATSFNMSSLIDICFRLPWQIQKIHNYESLELRCNEGYFSLFEVFHGKMYTTYHP